MANAGRVAALASFMLLGGLAGCAPLTAAAHTPTAVVRRAVRIQPYAITPTPAGTLAATAPLPNGELWVVAGSAASKGLFAVNLARHATVHSVSVSNQADAVVLAGGGLLALAESNPRSGAIAIVNPSTGAVAATVALGGPVYALAAGSGASVYALVAANASRSVVAVNTRTDAVTGSAPAPRDAVAVAPTPSGRHVYVLEPNGLVSEISMADGRIVAQFPVGHSGRALALSPGGSQLYVLKGQGGVRNVAVVNTATEAVTRALPAASHAIALILSPDGRTLYDVVGASGYGNLQAFHV